MNRKELFEQIKLRLRQAHGQRFRGLILYGCEAGGDAGPDSDIDLWVLLEGPLDYGQELMTNIEAVYPLTLECGRPISPTPAHVEEHRNAEYPLYQSAHAEGVLL